MRFLDTNAIARHLEGERFDEFLFALPTRAYYAPGGCDINPALYGAENTHSHLWNPEVDEREFRVIKKVLELNLPLLGICRGHQLITAAAGGTLFQDIHVECGLLWHTHGSVKVEPDSLLAKVINSTHPRANSLHHQAVRDVPPGWKVVAYADDGIIEAIECQDKPVISVQYHPEMLGDGQLDKMIDYLFSQLPEG